jgi:hypothetical protein
MHAGEVVGQAAWFDTIQKEDGTVVKLGQPELPVEGDAAALEAAVAEQAAAVRSLKEGGGKGNDDADVQEAVAELLRRKERLAAVHAALEAAAKATDAAEAPATSSP